MEKVFLILPYAAVRASVEVARSNGLELVAEQIPALRDIDQAILASEEKVRGCDNRDGYNLVTIAHLKAVLSCDAAPHNSNLPMTYSRQPMTPNELPLLDEYRPDTIKFHGSDDAFRDHFRSRFPELHGLDWNNMLVVGDHVLTTLLQLDSGRHHDPFIMEIRLYGLSPNEATEKVRQIHRVWHSNLPQERPFMMRNPQFIQFIRPGISDATIVQSIVIPLKVWPTMTDALLDVALDPWAICFTGEQVLMLPRCARAIETGYSILTTRLVFDYPIWKPPTETNMLQVIRYSRRGFGIRTIRAYSRFCEDTELEPPRLRKSESLPSWALRTPVQCPADNFESLSAYRRVDGDAEAGFKTVRRIAYLGQDHVNRIAIGKTPLEAAFDPQRPPTDVGIGVGVLVPSTMKHFLDEIRISRERVPRIEQYLLDRSMMEHGTDLAFFEQLLNPTLTQGVQLDIPPFEGFVRVCESTSSVSLDAFHCQNEPENLHSTWFASCYGYYGNYDETQWANNIQDGSNVIFDRFIKLIVNARVQGNHRFGYNNFLTSRIRVACSSSDIDFVLGQKLTVPLLITKGAENDLGAMLPPTAILPICRAEAHLPGSDYSGAIPPVPENQDELGNMRYLCIEPDYMWRGFNPERDEAIEILHTLALLTAIIPDDHEPTVSCGTPWLQEELRQVLCHRPAGMFPEQSRDGVVKGTLICTREAMLYRAWVMAIPAQSQRTSPTEVSTGSLDGESGQVDLNYLYPVPDELFWGPEFEGNDGKRAATKLKKSNLLGNNFRHPWWFREEAYTGLADDHDEDAQQP